MDAVQDRSLGVSHDQCCDNNQTVFAKFSREDIETIGSIIASYDYNESAAANMRKSGVYMRLVS